VRPFEQRLSEYVCLSNCDQLGCHVRSYFEVFGCIYMHNERVKGMEVDSG